MQKTCDQSYNSLLNMLHNICIYSNIVQLNLEMECLQAQYYH